jgi:hypothetical protein
MHSSILSLRRRVGGNVEVKKMALNIKALGRLCGEEEDRSELNHNVSFDTQGL